MSEETVVCPFCGGSGRISREHYVYLIKVLVGGEGS